MTNGRNQVGYSRAAAVVWRDTGARILALPLGGSAEMVVLGGGTAQIWRLLSRRHTIAEIAAAFRSVEEDVPVGAVDAALQSLVNRGLVVAGDEE